jgi:PAS domain S-box-containing protein
MKSKEIDLMPAMDVLKHLNAASENEPYFKMLAELMPSKVSNSDATGKVLYFNQKWLDYSGYNFEDLRDFGYHKIMHPDEIDEFKKRFQNAAESGTTLEMEMRFLNKEGLYIWHLNLASPIFDENGNVKMWVGSTTEIQKIKESESYFRMMAEMLPEKITNAKTDGIPFFYNKSWLDYTGASLTELVNEGWRKWVHIDDLPEAKKRWDNSVLTECDFDMELRLLSKNGNYRWHNSKARIVKDFDNKSTLWLGFNNDIHDQKCLTEDLESAIYLRTTELQIATDQLINKNKEIAIAKENLLFEYSRSLIEASLDPLVAISTEGKITDMNQATINAIGINREKLIGTDFFEYFTDPVKAKEVYKQVFEKGFVTNYPLTIKDHNRIDVLFNGSVYKDGDGEIVGAVVVARDITLQKIFEKELTEAKIFAELSTEIAEEATNKAQKATQLAEEAVKTKQQFLSNMSHEIRTPMNAIIGFTKVVLRTELTAKQKEYLTAIKMSGDALIVLINDILDLAKVDAGKMVFEETPFKLALSISAMLHLFETKIEEKNLQLVKEYDANIPEVLIGDSVRLHQIILNLLSNSVKFTAEGKIKVSIKLISETTETATIKFAVSDTGIGINEEKLETIFENFQQATSSTSRIYGGTGLGLAIVKQLVESQGGIIKVESIVGKGSIFSFVLDFKKTEVEALLEPEIVELDRQIKDIKVLVVEDMALNQLLMKTLLDDFGFECDLAANGKIAIEKLTTASIGNPEETNEKSDLVGERNRTKPYDIILMDLQMPEMNGYEATDYIRKILKSDMPIIALTADVTTVDLEKCKAIGMNDYLSKPVDERLLYSKIVNLIKKPMVVVLDNKTQNNNLPKQKYVDLAYLLQRTKSNPKLMVEMISVYLEQTPPLIFAMKQSLKEKDWNMLQSAVHKMIPSFSIMGMSTDFEDMAKKIQEFASAKLMTDGIEDLVDNLEKACNHAFHELELELAKFKMNL